MNSWRLAYDGYDPAAEGVREALCTLGNGYLATRGAAPESAADEAHYPGTYAAGCYNRLTDVVGGVVVENESLVNLPNWLPMTFRAGDGEWFGSAGVQVFDHSQTLDLRGGVLTRQLRVRDNEGHTTRVTQRRFVHMRHQHLCGLQNHPGAGGLVGHPFGALVARCLGDQRRSGPIPDAQRPPPHDSAEGRHR